MCWSFFISVHEDYAGGDECCHTRMRPRSPATTWAGPKTQVHGRRKLHSWQRSPILESTSTPSPRFAAPKCKGSLIVPIFAHCQIVYARPYFQKPVRTFRVDSTFYSRVAHLMGHKRCAHCLGRKRGINLSACDSHQGKRS